MSIHNNHSRLLAVAAIAGVGIALAGASIPAYAAEAEVKAAATESGAQGSSGSATGTQKARNTKYCYISEVTGTRIEKKICRTKDEWAKKGIDVDAK